MLSVIKNKGFKKGGIFILVLEKINNEKYLITLSKEDINILNSSFEKLTFSGKDSGNITKKLIKKLFLRSDINNFFGNSKNKFNIELVLKDNKYSVFISKKENFNKLNLKKFFVVKKEAVPYIFKFETLEDFIKFCKKINRKQIHTKNSLVFYENSYYAIFYFKDIVVPINERIILTEHASFIGKGWAKAARILEFCKEIISTDAIKTFSKFF